MRIMTLDFDRPLSEILDPPRPALPILAPDGGWRPVSGLPAAVEEVHRAVTNALNWNVRLLIAIMGGTTEDDLDDLRETAQSWLTRAAQLMTRDGAEDRFAEARIDDDLPNPAKYGQIAQSYHAAILKAARQLFAMIEQKGTYPALWSDDETGEVVEYDRWDATCAAWMLAEDPPTLPDFDALIDGKCSEVRRAARFWPVPGCPVILQGEGNPAIIRGELVPPPSGVAYRAVAALVSAYGKRLVGSKLNEQAGGDARKALKALAGAGSRWAAVIDFPKGHGNGYAIV